jgi:hypothetical protein
MADWPADHCTGIARRRMGRRRAASAMIDAAFRIDRFACP